ncbi:hypothetical protein A0H76_1887 [Hepatospora eriocheir]|uniref:Uncharacterized protein n=1 Tax=Hepatospora eriocheir TaxID=1081669 RepID=A0A1X0QGC0_9MICR|nr:hypothetical protein A0H76_1887 [Hepatospora eriocheir]
MYKYLFKHKQKYHKGKQPIRECGIFELIDCLFTPVKITLQVISYRTANTLLSIIEQVCTSGTIIHND